MTDTRAENRGIVGRIHDFWYKSSRPNQINNKTKFQIAFPYMPVQISNALIHGAYLKYYTDIIGMDIRYMGIIYLLFSIWNAVNDPMMGVFIDRFKYRKNRGKYTYLMRVTAPVTLIASALMLFAQPEWSEWLIFAFLSILLFIFDTTQTAYSICQASYILVAAPSKDERVGTSVATNYVGQAGAFLGSIIPTLLLVGDTKRGLTVTLFSLVLVVNSILYYIALRPLKENADMFRDEIGTEEGRLVEMLKKDARSLVNSRAFITWILFNAIGRGPTVFFFQSLLYMADHVLRLTNYQTTIADVVPGLIMFLFLPLFGKYSKKIGVRRMLFLGALPLALGYLGIYFIGNMWQAMIAFTVVIVFTNIPAIAGPVMMGAVIDEDERRTGTRKAGLFMGVSALVAIPVGGLHMFIFTQVVGFFGYQSGIDIQPETAQQGIRIASSIIPAVFILLGMIPMFLSPITREVEKELSAFSEWRRRVPKTLQKPQ